MVKQQKNILLTFDHELFLGEKSGSVDDCMIKPTHYLQAIFDEFKIEKAIFFLDTTYVSCLKKNIDNEACSTDFGKIKANVRFLLEKGHYVFPHIHPHWLDAKFDGENWSLTNLSKYTFKACSQEERETIWAEVIGILKMFEVDKYHSIDGFRAGGWSLQPFSDYKPFFLKYGIKYDFTVMPGSYAYTDAQQFDFTSVKPVAKYLFEDKVTHPEANGSFVEFPISSIPKKSGRPLMERMLHSFLWRTGDKYFGKGKSVLPEKLNYTPDKKPTNTEMISIELLHQLNIKKYEKYLDSNDVMHFISHPKMLTKNNLKVFRSFLKRASKKYRLNFDFRSLCEHYVLN